MMSKKVTIEISENGWETKVEIDGKTYIEKHRRTNLGSKSIEGDFENELTGELYEALSGFAQYDIMEALKSS